MTKIATVRELLMKKRVDISMILPKKNHMPPKIRFSEWERIFANHASDKGLV